MSVEKPRHAVAAIFLIVDIKTPLGSAVFFALHSSKKGQTKTGRDVEQNRENRERKSRVVKKTEQ